ncbi:TBCC-domain-containing protein [Calocera cornea HHB12733]|uniref:TBCC-domain-containing protein n=1 Tax=Calocera cornea HHB12733 TaxID=1353952 RepID=A0A165I2H4_9BASI|nr:TBCC-domain-containing protein [Calocera cornea HHB12733]
MALRADLTASLSLLTAYDQRQLDLQLKSLEQQLRDGRAIGKQQGKFSFKRTKPPAKAPTASVPDVPESKAAATDVGFPARPAESSSGHTISSLSDTCITQSHKESNDAADILLSSLDHCLVNLIPAPSSAPPPEYGSIHARALQHTVLLLPQISGSVFLEDCTECLIVVGCHQFRMHSSTNTAVLLNVNSVPIIEHCSGITVGAYPEVLRTDQTGGPGLDSKHDEMQDFNWLHPGRSPNWNPISSEAASNYNERVRSLLQVPRGPIVGGALGL